MTRTTCFIALACSCIAPAARGLAAQQAPLPPASPAAAPAAAPAPLLTPALALAAIARNGQSDPAAKVLAQDGAPQDSAALDELADVLVRVAVEFAGGESDLMAKKRAMGAVNALAHAGSERAAVRYAGAYPRLESIVADARDRSVRTVALQSLVSVAQDAGPVIPLLVTLASSPDPLASDAVAQLGRYTGGAGLAALKRLHAGRKIVDPDARSLVAMMAKHFGW